jgi:cephalosporin-C deacetylase-like acetyl esterase
MLGLLLGVLLSPCCFAQVPDGPTLPNTGKLELIEPLDVVMVRGVSQFAEGEIARSRDRRAALWNRDYSSPAAYAKSVEPNRERFRQIIGAVDPRVLGELQVSANPAWGGAHATDPVAFRREALEGVDVEGLVSGEGPSSVILVPDADWAPEAMYGLAAGLPAGQQLAQRFPADAHTVFTVSIVDRQDTWSGHPDIRYTNEPHREFLYRPAFEMGRHVIGYEVQKILSLVDDLDAERQQLKMHTPITVWGIGEGGLLALYAAALDPRIDVCVVSGYFQERENAWKEPIYRNVWKLLAEFGDADLASLIAPRKLIIEACAAPQVEGPPKPHDGRGNQAAPGAIVNAPIESVEREFARAKEHFQKLNAGSEIVLLKSADGAGPPGSDELLKFLGASAPSGPVPTAEQTAKIKPLIDARQKRQIAGMDRFTQRLMHSSDKARAKLWSKADRSSPDAWAKTAEAYRNMVYDELIGRLPDAPLAPNVKSRKVIDEPTHVGYEVTLDLYDGVIAGGILLVPKDLKPDEKRPLVVCQHGLEGVPMDTIITDPKHPGYGAYKGFSTQLVNKGFIVYAPQNPYRGHDDFRVIQRKSNLLGRSLFSYIIPQHQQTLDWLATLPYIDRDRMSFYGLSYGGKTAVRVPPMLVPTKDRAGYCLSICSADYNEWVRKNASTEDRYSYVFTPEYEIFEWNMGHLANYAELATLMTPRPFMVERGHDDGVAPDEWVAWEFAKVQRHYDQMGLGEKTEMEVFNGPHTINGKGTFRFLEKHLNWRRDQQSSAP